MKASTVLKWVMCALPFVYVAQVLLMRNGFVPLPYLLLLLSMMLTFAVSRGRRLSTRRGAVIFDLSIAAFTFMNLPWVLYEGVVQGPDDALRVLIFFVVPPLMYFVVSRYCSSRDVTHLIKIAALTALAVGLELLYEKYWNFVLESTSPFQNWNLEYVAQVGSGTILPQLANLMYRSPGILEHLHATATYLGIGVIASLHLVLEKHRWYLGCLYITAIALVFSGGRTALVGTVIAGLAYWRIRKKHLGTNRTVRVKRGGAMLKVSILLVLVVAVVARIPQVREIYSQLLGGQLAAGNTSFIADTIPDEFGIWYDAMADRLWAVPFGLGPGPRSLRAQLSLGSDDFFPVDLLGRYGVLGTVLFYSTYFAFLAESAFALRRRRTDRLAPFAVSQVVLAVSIVTLLMFTTLHSGALMRKSVFPWLFIAYGLGRQHFAPARQAIEGAVRANRHDGASFRAAVAHSPARQAG